MPENRNFVLIKTTPNDVLFTIASVENPAATREIYLTKQHARQPLPADWALNIIANPSLYSMYKKGLITFDDNEALIKLAYERGYLFDESLEFTPASPKDSDTILAVLKAGNKSKIEECIKQFGKDKVEAVAIAHLQELTQNVIITLEKLFGVQLIMDNVADLVND